jgi:DNA repair exonuclease SbcCD ATPase subunit
MRLNKLTLKNCYQYAFFEFEYKCGITGVFGRNGSGKSNLIDEAQFFAITGQAADKKEDMLKWGHSEGYTELDFEHEGKEYYLRRNIHNSTAVLRWHGPEGKGDEKGAKKIDAKIQEMLGMTYDVFRETCFCPQDGLVAILRMQSAQRMTYFQKLASATKAETLRMQLQTKLNSIPEYPDKTNDIEIIRSVIDGSNKIITDLEARIKEYVLPSVTDKEHIYKQLSLPSKEDIYREHSELLVRISAESVQAASLADKKKALLGSLTQPERITLEEEQAEKQYTQKQLLESQLAAAERSVQALRQPLPVPAEVDMQELETLRQVLMEQAALYQMAKSGICPTCQRAFDLPQDKETIISVYEDTKAFLESEEKQRQALFKERQRILDHNTRIAAETESAVKQAQQLQKQLQSVAGCVFDPVKMAEKRKALSEWINNSRRAQELDSQIATVLARKAALEQQAEAVACKECLDEDTRAGLRSILSDIENVEKTFQDMKTTLAGEKARNDMQQKQLHYLLKEMETRAKYQKVRAYLEKSREVLHRNNLPRIVMQRMLSGLNAYMDFYLHKFDTDFSAHLDDDFNFKATFKDQVIDAGRLSGGQSVTLAIAFRFALSEYFAKSIPLLVLDEPTVWLDEVNIGRMVEVLQMARTFTEKGVYVLVATHEPQLSAAMSRVVHVDAK